MATILPVNTQPAIPQVLAPAAARAELVVASIERQTGNPGIDVNKPEAPATASARTVKPAAKPLSKEELSSQVQALQDKMDKLNPALAFVVDQSTGKALIQLTDRATKEVILQFPSEAALQITRALDRFQKGQLISRTV